MVTLKTYTSAIDVDIDRSILEANGIRCHLPDESFSAVGIGALGIRLQVAEADLERAKALLRDEEAAPATTPQLGAEPSRDYTAPRRRDLVIFYVGFGLLALVIFASIVRRWIFGH